MSLPCGFVIYDLLFKNCFLPHKICTNVLQFAQIFFSNTHHKCVASTGPSPNLKCALLKLVSIVFYVQENCSVYNSKIGLPVLFRWIILFFFRFLSQTFIVGISLKSLWGNSWNWDELPALKGLG